MASSGALGLFLVLCLHGTVFASLGGEAIVSSREMMERKAAEDREKVVKDSFVQGFAIAVKQETSTLKSDKKVPGGKDCSIRKDYLTGYAIVMHFN